MLSESPLFTRLFIPIFDLVTIFVSFVTTGYLRNRLNVKYDFGATVDWFQYPTILFMFVMIWLLLMTYQSAYSEKQVISFRTNAIIVFRTVLLGGIVVLALAFMIRSPFPRSFVLLFSLVCTVFLLLNRGLIFFLIKYLKLTGRIEKVAMVIGVGDIAKAFLKSNVMHNDWGFKIVGLISPEPDNNEVDALGYKIIGNVQDLRQLLHDNPIDELIIAVSSQYFHLIENAVRICDEEGVTVRVVSLLFKNLISKARAEYFHGVPMVSYSSVERSDFEII
ncbi:hypothetical protein, partial [Desulfatibacillum alkenivorans]